MSNNFSDDFFLNIINLEHRKDRKEECKKELYDSSIIINDHAFFNAHYKPDFGALGASISHANVLSQYLSTSSAPYAIIFEDDFLIHDKIKFIDDISIIMGSSQYWDLFLLSHNQSAPIERINHEEGFWRVVNSQTASAYIVKREFAPKLISVFFESVVALMKLSDHEEKMRKKIAHHFCLDILWKRLQTEYRFVTRYPSYVKQRASYSDIEKRNVDYNV